MNGVRLSGIDRGDARSVAGILLDKNGPGDGDPSLERFRLTQLFVPVLGGERGAHCSVENCDSLGSSYLH